MNSRQTSCLAARQLRILCGALLCAAALAACGPVAHEYYWSPYPVADKRVVTGAKLAEGGTVAVVHDNSNADRYMIGEFGIHQFYTSLSQLGDAVATQLADELRKRNFTIDATAPKSLKIRVTSASTTFGLFALSGYIGIDVAAGNGYRIVREIKNSTPTTVPRAFDGAVAIAVIEILNDPKIVAYLTGPG